MDFILIANSVDVLRRRVQIDTWNGQINLGKFHRGNLADHLHYRGGDPAEVVELIKLNKQPFVQIETSAHGAGISGIQVSGVQIGDMRAVTAVRLLIDGHGRKGKGGCGAGRGSLGQRRG